MKARLILINGLAATGKTTIAKEISAKTSIPLITKDDIKELFYDKLGTNTRDYSSLLGAASFETLYIIAQTFLSNGQSVIIECPFITKFAKPKLQKIIRDDKEGKYSL